MNEHIATWIRYRLALAQTALKHYGHQPIIDREIRACEMELVGLHLETR